MITRHGSQSSNGIAPIGTVDGFAALANAARDGTPVNGWTHNFYRYPARFSPQFVAAAIAHFSSPGDVVLDPYMGGGTTVVEGMLAGRSVIGNDLNSLAVFVTRAKTTALQESDVAAIRQWVSDTVPTFGFHRSRHELDAFIDPVRTKNLEIPRARFLKKAIAAALASVANLETAEAQQFVRCAVLRTSQWALDGRVRHTSLADFREKLATTTANMLTAIEAFAQAVRASGGGREILNLDAATLDAAPVFARAKGRASLVVTSPPYPGVHVLYHRWQVDGRRETPAPYWIAGCNDGQGASFYNFGDRRQTAADNYFRSSLLTLLAIRRAMRDGGCIIQMVAFNRPEEQMPRYLANMQAAGFEEWRGGAAERIWRQVPHRKWHATLRGKTHSSNEVVLIHRAV